MLHSENSGFSTCGSHRENFLNFVFDGFHLHFSKCHSCFPFHINVRCLVWQSWVRDLVMSRNGQVHGVSVWYLRSSQMSATSPGQVDNIFHICICINVGLGFGFMLQEMYTVSPHSKMQ